LVLLTAVSAFEIVNALANELIAIMRAMKVNDMYVSAKGTKALEKSRVFTRPFQTTNS
jgi:predicted outer membrane lipoprotein